MLLLLYVCRVICSLVCADPSSCRGAIAYSISAYSATGIFSENKFMEGKSSLQK